MRRAFVVLLILVSLVLVLQSPAYAYHKFYSVDLESKGGSGTFSVTTDCAANSTFVLKSASFNLGPTADRGFVKLKVPKGKIIRKTSHGSVSKFRFTTEKLSSHAHGTATFTATCDGHPLRAGEAYTKNRKQTLSLDLPMTGVPVLLLLALGLGLTLAGGVLIALGRTGESSPG